MKIGIHNVQATIFYIAVLIYEGSGQVFRPVFTPNPNYRYVPLRPNRPVPVFPQRLYPFLRFYPLQTPAPTSSTLRYLRVVAGYNAIRLLLRSRDQTTQATTTAVQIAAATTSSVSPASVTNMASTNIPSSTTTPYWMEWTSWSLCSKLHCGMQKRTRVCVGGGCEGSAEESRDCNVGTRCAFTGTWNEWTSWNCDISRDCTPGVAKRSRTCNGDSCFGSSRETTTCSAPFRHKFWFWRLCMHVMVIPETSSSSEASTLCSRKSHGIAVITGGSLYRLVVGAVRSMNPDGFAVWTASRYLYRASMSPPFGTNWYGSTPARGSGWSNRLQVVVTDRDATSGFRISDGLNTATSALCFFVV